MEAWKLTTYHYQVGHYLHVKPTGKSETISGRSRKSCQDKSILRHLDEPDALDSTLTFEEPEPTVFECGSTADLRRLTYGRCFTIFEGSSGNLHVEINKDKYALRVLNQNQQYLGKI